MFSTSTVPRYPARYLVLTSTRVTLSKIQKYLNSTVPVLVGLHSRTDQIPNKTFFKKKLIHIIDRNKLYQIYLFLGLSESVPSLKFVCCSDNHSARSTRCTRTGADEIARNFAGNTFPIFERFYPVFANKIFQTFDTLKN